MREFETNEEIENIIETSADAFKTNEALKFTNKLIKKHNITVTDYAWLSLTNHIAAMVERSTSGTVYEGIEVDIFNEISRESIDMAAEVVDFIDNLDRMEAYLLSVHFEAAKINGLQ